MARNFLSYPFAPYSGQLSSKAFNDARGNQKGLMVGFSVFWATYQANGSPLGLLNPNFTVQCNLNGAGPNTVSQGWTVESVYVDNENVNFPVYVFFPSTGFALSCPPNSSGWYQVFTLDRLALIAGIGIPDVDIANAVRTNVFFTDAKMVPYLDQEQQTAVAYGLASPLITLGSSGGGLASIGVVLSGSNYAAGTLSIVGGGGVTASAVGTVDSFGRFTSVTITNPGSAYIGFPVITPTAAQNRFLPWVNGAGYAAGAIVVDNGAFFQAKSIIAGGNAFIEPQSNPNFWTYTGIAANSVASFNSTIAPNIGGSSISASSNFGARALGDQSQALLDVVAAPGVFRNNLWGTPFGSGFIYITNVFIASLNAGSGDWQLEDQAGDVLWKFDSNAPAVRLDLQGCNIKLPATSTWRLNATGVTTAMALSHGWAWTYSQQ